MDPYVQHILILAAFALGANMPLGYFRAPCRKFSFKWFLHIHLSIPFIILIRVNYGIGISFAAMTIPLAVIGQIIGARIYKKKVA